MDWGRNVAYEVGASYLTKYGLLTGIEENFIALSAFGAGTVGGYIGLADNGNIFTSGFNDFNNGRTLYLNSANFAVISTIVYPSPQFGEAGMTAVSATGSQYLVDRGVLDAIQELSTTTWYAAQNYVGDHGRSCAGPTGSGIVWMMSAPGGSFVGPITLSKILFDSLGFVSNTVVGTISMGSIDGAWTGQFQIQGLCLDQTDNKILAVIGGAGGSNVAYVCKIDPVTAGVDWKTTVPPMVGGGALQVGDTFQYSSIKHQRLAVYTGQFTPAVVIYNTSTGAVDSTVTAGIAGFFPYIGQAYSDSLGGIIFNTDFTNGAGSPTLLNSTPTSWSGSWSILYVAAPITPPAATGRRFANWVGRGLRRISPPVVFDFRVTEDGQQRTTEGGDSRITQ